MKGYEGGNIFVDNKVSLTSILEAGSRSVLFAHPLCRALANDSISEGSAVPRPASFSTISFQHTSRCPGHHQTWIRWPLDCADHGSIDRYGSSGVRMENPSYRGHNSLVRWSAFEYCKHIADHWFLRKTGKSPAFFGLMRPNVAHWRLKTLLPNHKLNTTVFTSTLSTFSGPYFVRSCNILC